MSESLRLLTINERMSRSLVFLSKLLICSFSLIFLQKTNDSLKKPMCKFPTLDHAACVADVVYADALCVISECCYFSVVAYFVYGESACAVDVGCCYCC